MPRALRPVFLDGQRFYSKYTNIIFTLFNDRYRNLRQVGLPKAAPTKGWATHTDQPKIKGEHAVQRAAFNTFKSNAGISRG